MSKVISFLITFADKHRKIIGHPPIFRYNLAFFKFYKPRINLFSSVQRFDSMRLAKMIMME